jgi:DNA topoisomerase-3
MLSGTGGKSLRFLVDSSDLHAVAERLLQVVADELVRAAVAIEPVGGTLVQLGSNRLGNAAVRDVANENVVEAKPSLRPRLTRLQQPATHERKQGGHPEPKRPTSGRPTPPTARMVAFAERLAKDKKATLPSGYAKDFDICRRFLDQHATR